MNLKQRFMNRLEGKDSDIVPVGCTTTYGVVDIMKKVGHERPLADTDPVAMAGLALGYVEAGFEWCKAMGWDITAVSEVMGCTIGEPKIDIQKFIKEHPYAESLDGLAYPDNLFEKGRFPAYKEQFKILKEKLGDEVAIFGETEGAWTAACNLVGTEKFMKWTFKEKEKVQQVLDVTTEVVIDVINWAFDQGADYYVVAEPSSGPALMSPRTWKQFVLPMMTKVAQRSKGPVVLHVCANTDSIIEFMCDTGVAGISIEEKADMKAAVEIARPKGVKVFGNVATATTMFMGTPEECYKESIAALENGCDFLTPGCGIAPGSPLVNVQQLRKARDDYFKVG
ncbi:MtaA/CmuA family methyltransferase [Desulfatitalea alkaliphila]|uniref:MtaA/CmuA family methyltransferase n=1 Tax=Desulfatitalea alkaliphila TaxID=2929485 RepID=A0AA41UJT0_9BACT|nr:MtaA/CmuA family methyltransferase [Desulfatitalea alkaliphila]MCJ8499606.1 MtaA/CmuA family methyltransferase [Desulfatitalea alkaliphila]